MSFQSYVHLVFQLLTSFDGASFHFPPEITKRGWYRKTWYHTDQSYFRPDFECVQSWVTAYDVILNAHATLAFMECSNIYHKRFSRSFSNQRCKSDWYNNSESISEIEKIKCKWYFGDVGQSIV